MERLSRRECGHSLCLSKYEGRPAYRRQGRPNLCHPQHICQYGGDLYVACGSNKIRKIDGMDYTVSDYRTFSQQVKRYHKFGQYALVVLESGTYLVDETKE